MPRVEQRLRADAARNLARILEAAHVVLAERGSEASMAEIAARAGVGTATIYRRFPTKDDLLAAMFEQGVARLAAEAAAAAEAKDVGRALRQFMQRAAAAHMQDRGYCDCAETNLKLRPEIQRRFEELIANADRLLARAKEAGEVREDVNAYDLPVLLMAVAHAGLLLEERVPGAWKRYLDIVLDGLRPEAARPLSRRPLAARDLRPPG
ncbi:MAG TPA: helix-turn-helix domain-containing protein [Gaiellaceae bacterium]